MSSYARRLDRNLLINEAAKSTASWRMRKPEADDVKIGVASFDQSFFERAAALIAEKDEAALGRIFIDTIRDALVEDEIQKIETSGEVPEREDDGDDV